MAFGVNVTDIIEGTSPTLRGYAITRAGEGARIEQAHGMVYYNLAAPFQNRISEPLYVEVGYNPEAEQNEIELTTHEGQECDLVISGSLKLQIGSHISKFCTRATARTYDSSIPHGMIAVGGEDCRFYAIVLNPSAYKDAHSTGGHPRIQPKRRKKRQERVGAAAHLQQDLFTP